MMFAWIDILAQEGNVSSGLILTIFSGLLITVAGKYVYEIITEWRSLRRLKRALLFDCVATINKFTGPFGSDPAASVLHDLSDLSSSHSGRGIRQDEAWTTDATYFISGLALSGPNDSCKGLMVHLRADGARYLSYYLDRWQLVFEIEKRYSKAVDDLLLTVRDGEDRATQVVRQEYWERANSDVRHLEHTVVHLCYFAFKIFRLYAPAGDLHMSEDSCDRWTNWEQFNQEWEPFRAFVECGDKVPLAKRFSVNKNNDTAVVEPAELLR